MVAGSRVRTDDLLITNQLLYQLSYTGVLSLRMAVGHQKPHGTRLGFETVFGPSHPGSYSHAAESSGQVDSD